MVRYGLVHRCSEMVESYKALQWSVQYRFGVVYQSKVMVRFS